MLTKFGSSASQTIRGKVWGRVTAHLRSRVTAGFLVLLPILFSLLILRFAFNFVDGILNPRVEEISNRSIPGLRVAALIFIIYALGLLTIRRVGAAALEHMQQFLLTAPVVRTIFQLAKSSQIPCRPKAL